VCIIFSAGRGEQALVGNNEDFIDPHTKVWFLPPQGGQVGGASFEAGRFGRVYFGYGNFYPQGGMNEAGLVFDYTATVPLPVLGAVGKPIFDGDLTDKVMAECATVAEALALLDGYNLEWLERACLFLADAGGDSAIVEGDVVLPKQGAYQVLTNFYQSRTEPGEIPCQRYRIAAAMLEGGDDISLDLFRRILAATHQEGWAHTVYSNIYDPRRGIVYLYHFHNFENAVRLDLREELAAGLRALDLPGLFPETHAARTYTDRFDFARGKTALIDRRRAEGEIMEFGPDFRDRYAGRYRLSAFGEVYVEVIQGGAGLFCRIVEPPGHELYHMQEMFAVAESQFVVPQAGKDWELCFQADGSGQITRLTIDRGDGWQVPGMRM
jgi:hypothetical protein